MMLRRLTLIATLALLPSLAACSGGPEPLPPLSEEALAAVVDDPGAPKKQLAREFDEVFSSEAIGETRAAVVIHNGQRVAERYAPGYDEKTRFISWSMAKTMTAVMIGMLVSEGKLQIDDPAPIPRWQQSGDPRSEITLRQLLQMRAGLRHTEAGDPPYESSEVRMLFLDGRGDMADWATAQPLEAEPGAQFEYSSNTTVILADIAARALTDSPDPDERREAVAGFLQTRLFDPLGMASAFPEFDASGTLIGGSMVHATARDWATFGEFLRNRGSHQGAQLVPRGWVDFMVTPSPRAANYGGQTWLNRPTGEEPHPLFPDRAPRSVFAAIGHMGQYVIVSPKQRLTVVRLGHSSIEERERLIDQVADIFALYPET